MIRACLETTRGAVFKPALKVGNKFLEERAAKRERLILRWAHQQIHDGPAFAGAIHRERRFEFAPLKEADLHFQPIRNRTH
jgi:hypothetical protein